jgi:hypothetical protein
MPRFLAPAAVLFAVSCARPEVPPSPVFPAGELVDLSHDYGPDTIY